jgi:hypothetical protein
MNVDYLVVPDTFVDLTLTHVAVNGHLQHQSALNFQLAPTVITISNSNSSVNLTSFYSHHHHRLDSPTWILVFLRSFCQLKYPAIASSDFVTRVFSRVGLSAPRPTPAIPEGLCFLSVLSLLAD